MNLDSPDFAEFHCNCFLQYQSLCFSLNYKDSEMKVSLPILLLIIGSFTVWEPVQDPEDSNEYQVVFNQFDMKRTGFMPDTFAKYPSGINGIKKYFAKNIRYPVNAAQKNQKGRVIVSHSVDIDGSVDELIVIQSAGKTLDKEVIRLTKKMTDWLPAIKDGKPVKVYYQEVVLFHRATVIN